MAKIAKGLFRGPNSTAGADKRAISNTNECLAGWEIPIANTPNELAAMDFADYGDFATCLNIQDAFPRFSVIVFISAMKNEHRKRYEKMRFRIGWQRLGRLISWR